MVGFFFDFFIMLYGILHRIEGMFNEDFITDSFDLSICPCMGFCFHAIIHQHSECRLKRSLAIKAGERVTNIEQKQRQQDACRRYRACKQKKTAYLYQ